MKIKILLAIAGTAALSACGRHRGVEVEEFPLVPLNPPPAQVTRPVAPRPTQGPPTGFRVPDPTRDLYPLRTTGTTSPAPSLEPADPLATGPLSAIPPTPAPQPIVAPSE